VREAIPELWPRMLNPQVKVDRLWTRSPFAQAGRPVYMVSVMGEIEIPPHPRHPGYNTVCGVDAHTGEILTEAVEPPSEPEPDTQVTVSSDEALQIAKNALPAGLQEPEMNVLDLTPRSRLAPLGTLVYPIRITGKIPAGDDSDELWQWAQSWAVDANTGHIYGLWVNRSTE